MPELDGKARDLYIHAYGEDKYNSSNDAHNGRTHGGTLKKDTKNELFFHRPDHDVESIFWTLFSALLRAVPHDAKETFSNDRYYIDTAQIFYSHNISSVIDTRRILMQMTTDEFEKALHPGLRSLAPMLSKMVGQIQPEYDLLFPKPKKEHLHKALHRLILQQLVEMESVSNPIPLSPGKKRELPQMLGTYVAQSSHGSKRSYTDPSPRKRSKGM